MLAADLYAARPTPGAMRDALEVARGVLGVDVCWVHRRRYHFPLGEGWTIALCSESAGRIRAEACRWTRPVATLWALAGDRERLAGIVLELAADVAHVRGAI
jgi:hypothetical protein